MGASTMSLAVAALLLLMSVAAATDMSTISYGGERSEEETQRMYAEWMATHGRRSYDNAIGEEEEHYQVFKDTLHYIYEHNTAAATHAGVHSFRLGLIPPTAVDKEIK